MSSLVMNKLGDQKDGNGFDLIQNRIESLSSKMDTLINIQEKVLNRLDGMSQDIDGIEKDVENLKVDKEEIHFPPPPPASQTQAVGSEVRDICRQMSGVMLAVNRRSEQQAQKLEGMEKLVLSMQQAVAFIGDAVKNSRLMELVFRAPVEKKHKGKLAARRKSSAEAISKKHDKKSTSNKASKGNQEISPACEPAASLQPPSHRIKLHGPKHFLASRKCGKFLKDHKGKDATVKSCLSPKGLKTQKKTKPPDTSDHISLKKQLLLIEEVQKLNRENEEKSGHISTSEHLDLQAGATPQNQRADATSVQGSSTESKVGPVEEKEEQTLHEEVKEVQQEEEEEEKEEEKEVKEEEAPAAEEESESAADDQKEQTVTSDDTSSPEREQETTTSVLVKEQTKSKEEEEEEEEEEEGEEQKEEDTEEDKEPDNWAIFKADGVEFQLDLKQRVEKARKEVEEEKDDEDDEVERYFIDTSPPPAAPFNHRIVSAKPHQICNFYTINWTEILGGGRFGQVHKCVENSSGLTLAAKVIKARAVKEKDVVKNEIQVMNNLDHASLIQLYAAYESRNDIILVLEYVDGGELFDRIIDENYTLMELDAVVFIRQICEGLQHMHKMYILHLDLKPENIMCVNRATNKIKIIDFGLARIYKPREKLRVNFGTPEFLAPEVINYDFVSFNTDMWSLGVITYMLLSSLCPFLGDDDNETLNNILSCKWGFEEQEFMDTSEQAKDFISRLLVVNKSWRMGAAEALRHPWLADSELHHRLYTKKTMCRSRRSSCVPNC